MPIYEDDENITLEHLLDLQKRNQCKECGGRLNVFQGYTTGLAYLACNDWNRTQHEGIEREPSRYEKEGLESLTIEKRREIMEQGHGEEKTKALGKYMGGGIVMTKTIATEIVETLWGDAPGIEKTKCVLLCLTYQLNPLMNHLYLVGYKRYKDKKLVVDSQGNPVIDWSIQQGIGATRLLAQRKHNYSYLDMTPRKATQAEIDKILGDTADKDSIYGFVWIKDQDSGAEAFGIRGIKKDENIKGTEKGNTHLNMACIRAERLALGRQYPGEMPPNIEVVDERYMDAPDVRNVDRATGEIVDSTARELPDEPTPPAPKPKEHWCQEHNCAYDKHTKGSSTWYSHPPKTPDGEWCYEIKKKNTVPAATAPQNAEPEAVIEDEVEALSTEECEPEPQPMQEPAANTIEDLKERIQLSNWSLLDVGKFCNADKHWNIQELADLTPEQIVELIDHIKKNTK